MGLRAEAKKKTAVLYIHGVGGGPQEAEHYIKIFLGSDVFGFGYDENKTPWDVKEELLAAYYELIKRYDQIILVANSYGAFLAMLALGDKDIKRAFFISPIVDMQELILKLLEREEHSLEELKLKKEIILTSGQKLSWDYWQYVNENLPAWRIRTDVLYGDQDNLTDQKSIKKFVVQHKASLTVVEGGEHWFHTDEQMELLDMWLQEFLKMK